MADNGLAILLRVVAELFIRSSGIKAYIEQIGPGPSREHEQFTDSIRTALEGIENVVVKTLQYIRALPSERDQGKRAKALQRLLSDLAIFSEWFIKLHEFLVYLPRQPVTTETIYTLKGSFGRIYEDQSPSIILGSIFNALEFDFFEQLKEKLPGLDEIIEGSKNIVLQLPICDHESPPAWAVLAHELGHAVDLDRGISNKVAGQFVKEPDTEAFTMVEKWCGELCADLIAAETLGPGAILAVVNLEYCTYPLRPVYLWETTHPATRWRLKVVSDYLKAKYNGLDLLQKEKELFDSAWECSVAQNIVEPQRRDELRALDGRLLENLIEPIAAELSKEVLNLKLPKHVLRGNSLDRCLKRLKDGSPIGAQGEERKILTKHIQHYRHRRFRTERNRISAFRTLVKRFKEASTPLPGIILSGHRMRQYCISQFTENQEVFADKAALAKMCKKSADVDHLVTNSINSSGVHNRLARILRV